MEIKVVNRKSMTNNDLWDCAKLLGESFQNEPGLNWLCPDDRRELWFVETTKLILSSEKSELITMNDENGKFAACALVTPPHFKPKVIAQMGWLWGVWNQCGWSVVAKTFRYLSKSEKAKKPSDYCLEFIGVSDRHRGKGLSRKLIEFIRAKTGNDKLFLTTADPKNVDLYKHLGFSLIHKEYFSEIAVFAMRSF